MSEEYTWGIACHDQIKMYNLTENEARDAMSHLGTMYRMVQVPKGPRDPIESKDEFLTPKPVPELRRTRTRPLMTKTEIRMPLQSAKRSVAPTSRSVMLEEGPKCLNDDCGAPAKKGQVYCSRPCYLAHRGRNNRVLA